MRRCCPATNKTLAGFRRTPLGRVIAGLLLLPFLLLSLMAQGTMVTAGPTQDTFMVVLCGDHRPVEMVLDESGNVVPAAEYRGKHQLPDPGGMKPACGWAVHAQPMLDSAPLPTITTRTLLRPANLSSVLPLRVLRAEVLAPLARGPPLV